MAFTNEEKNEIRELIREELEKILYLGNNENHIEERHQDLNAMRSSLLNTIAIRKREID